MAIGYGAMGGAANQILIRILGNADNFSKELGKADGDLSKFARKVSSTYAPMLGKAMLAAGAGIAAYSITAAAQYEQLSAGFHSLASSQGKDADAYIRKLKEMSHGTVAEAEIMRKANQAMLLGIDLDTITQMMEGAAVIAQATGQDVGYMFESLALGVGRQSRMLLDNLGIIVRIEEAEAQYAATIGKATNAMTEEEKKTAFLMATMKGLEERTKALGGFQANTSTEFMRLQASMQDTAVIIGQQLLPYVNEFIGTLNKWMIAGGAEKIVATLISMGKTAYVVADSFKLVGQSMGWVVAMASGDKAGAGRMWEDMSATSSSLEKDYKGIAEQLQIIFGEETQRVSTNQNITSSINAQTAAIQQQTAALNSQLSIEQKIQQLRSVGQSPYGWATRIESNLAPVRAGPGGTTIRAKDWNTAKANKSGI